ncbi:aminoglycoside phosphotransferase family protein [Streptomyces sp. NBC_01142]|uniref:phosphotransferase n=1 Tax=Streptomyces sp. NBC_01142 TaxID=2975865 RepID=UPI00224EE590|nr:phosphotransferase [Streptomyces sp. NBC_01142]MCX4825212.1 aminoglycoside phosphotransferase family protein [Streptomyces sp. NBC_01142]
MTGPAQLTVRHAMELVVAGDAEALEGRGLNSSYRVTEGGRELSVKVHCADRSSGTEFRRILRVDAALRGTAWYPPVLDMGFHAAGRPRLVVIRPYAPGAPSDDARQHIVQVAGVLADLAARAGGVEAEEDLVGDYASPWVSGAERERALADPLLTGEWQGLARAMDDHLGELRNSAVRLTRPDGLVIHHGDLHGRNLISGSSRPLTVIDWDEAGFSRRPADAGKALWLSCRLGRGDFVLDPQALHRFLTHLHARLRMPYASAADLARLGALWFLPRHGHVTLLGQRDVSLGPWYLDWISRFWARFRQNLDLLTRTAAALDTDADRGC